MSAPTGCSLVGYLASCSFATWNPPLMDSQFTRSPGEVVLNDVDGTIPNEAFMGLENSGGFTGTPQISLDCGWGNMNTLTLRSNSLSANLSWVQEMLITDCYNMQIKANAFSALTNSTLLTVMAGNVSSISSSAFSGLTSLTTLYFYAAFPDTGVPSGLFDGLTGLNALDMSRTALNSIPAGLFDDLKYLTNLQLLSTNLITLPSGIFYPLLSLTTLDISDNNFTCDCSVKWLGTYLQETGLATANCTGPAEYNGFDLTKVVRTLTCEQETVAAETADDNKFWLYGATAGASLAFILAVFAILAVIQTRKKLDETRTELSKLKNTKKANSKQGADNPAYEKGDSMVSLNDRRYFFHRKPKVAPSTPWYSHRPLDSY